MVSARNLNSAQDNLLIRPASRDLFGDMKQLFNQMGSSRGCWCMWWRIKRKDFERQSGQGNKQAMKEIVESGQIPGLLGYAGDEPVAWCSVAPREHFPVLDRSPVLKRVDDKRVWSIVCFFIVDAFKGQGLMSTLVEAALEYAQSHGAQIVEGYPVIPETSKHPEVSSYTGVKSVFDRLGFVEVARRSEFRPIMRYTFGSSTQD